MSNFFKNISFFIVVFLTFQHAVYSQTVVKGFVKDNNTMQPLAFASVYFEKGKGVTTGEDGSYSIQTQRMDLINLTFSYGGYKPVTFKVTPSIEQIINVELEPTKQLSEVRVKSKRGKYRNKNNPAVQLIDLVIENKNKNRISAYDFAQFKQYEKMSLSLTNKPEKLLKNRLFKNYKFILENVDTSTIEGKSLLPIYISEKLSDVYVRKSPSQTKTRILGEKKVNYGDFLDNNGINSFLKRLYADINIYDNNIDLLTVQFLSPIADMGPNEIFYLIIKS